MPYKVRNKPAKVIHMAGIVPVAGQPLDFKMPWNDSLMPIGPDYLAVERAVYECALAGCETIWVVCHVGTEPLLRKRLGDYITDPISIDNRMNPSLTRRDISILYVPIHPRDKQRRDCLSWSVLYGADNAFKVSAFLSKWIIPEKFYCAFPYGILSEQDIRKKRVIIAKNKKTMICYNGKTVKDGLHISFTFDQDDYKRCRDIVLQREINTWNHETKKNAREYSLQEVFSGLDFTDADVVELSWFYDISSWKNYCLYTASEHSQVVTKYKACFVKDKRKIFATEYEVEDVSAINESLKAEDPDKYLIENIDNTEK